ncbi:MAG: HEAT repeat domain-containing protein [Bryobacteraceae bacterium]
MQTRLSLYLYGELEFAEEEELEQHLGECAFCERALGREKALHAKLNAGYQDVPLDLLVECRQELKAAVLQRDGGRRPVVARLWRWAEPLGFGVTRWSMRLAVASFLVVSGFTAARWLDRHGMSGDFQPGNLAESGFINPSAVRIRDIQPDGGNRVRIVIDRFREQEVTGQVDDPDVRRLLLAGIKDPDPGIRVYSVEMFNGQNGDDIRDALLECLRQDPNAAVRLKALEALRPFTDDAATRDALKFVIEHDDNPGVRSEGIDVLVPAHRSKEISPDLANTLQEIMRSDHDDYVNMRCLQVLQQRNASHDVY